MQIITVIAIFTCLVLRSESAKILIIMPLETKSHFHIHEAVAKALGSKGHQVTFVAPYPLSKPWPNVELHQMKAVPPEKALQLNIYEAQTQSTVTTLLQFKGFILDAIPKLYTQPKVKSIIEEVKKKGKLYDVAIVDTFLNDFVCPFAAMVANHTMMLSVLNIPHWIAHEFRIPYPLATISSFYSEFSKPTTLRHRLESVVGTYSFLLMRYFVFLPEMNTALKIYLPENTPSIEDSMQKVSFILVNEDPVLSLPRPSLPFMATIAGIHLQEAKPLPKELEDFMQSSGEHGVILFSFGSFVDTRCLPKEMVDVFVRTFAKLKQKIIWKYHEPIKGISDNVKIVSWMPQRDILGHPKIRLFITHGGRLSSQETLYRAVPIIGIPVFADQMHNIDRIADVGYGLALKFFNITEEGFHDSIKTLLTDKRYQKKVKELSAIFRDRQNSPADTVNYWTEYVIRHNGAFHLKNEMTQQLGFFQYWLLDIYAVLLISIALAIIIPIKIGRLFFKIIR